MERSVSLHDDPRRRYVNEHGESNGHDDESRINACVVLSDAYKIDITDSYMRRTISPANAYEFAIRIADHSCCLLTFNVFVEGYNRFLYTQNPIYDLNVRSQLSKAAGNPDSLIYLDSSGKGQPGIISGSISIFPTVEPGVVSHNLIETSSSSHQLGVRNCELWLASKQNLSIAGGYTTGLVIHENASTSTVTLTPDAAYCSAVRLRQGSTDFVGKVNFGGDIGFFGTPATDQPTITGSCGNNAALSNLLTALANTGLIKDSTTR